MARLRFKDDANDLKATFTYTFEKPVIATNLLEKEMATFFFNKRIMEKIRTGKWDNSTKLEKEFAKKAKAVTIQNDLMSNGLRIYIPVTYRKQVSEKLQDVPQGINALKCSVKKAVWWPLMDNKIEQVVKNCTDCYKHLPRLKAFTDNRKECRPWEQFLMDWL